MSHRRTVHAITEPSARNSLPPAAFAAREVAALAMTLLTISVLSACSSEAEHDETEPSVTETVTDAAIESTSDDSAGRESEESRYPPRDDFEPDPEGEWLSLDLHVHAWAASNDAGPDSTPARIAEVARERGLFAVVLQDHSNSTGSDPFTLEEDPALYNQGPEFVHWDEAARLSNEEEFILVSGNEISPRDAGNSPVGHIGCVPRTLVSFDTETPFIDRPRGSISGGETLAQALDRNCFSIVNHPYAAASWIAYDWTSFDYHALEIWNGMLTTYDLQGRDAWRCDLLQGRHVTPIAASDNHRIEDPPPGTLFDPALGWPSTAVFSPERTWDGVITALETGLVTLFEGDSRLFLDAYDAGRWRSEGVQTRFLRVRGTLDAASGNSATLQLTRAFNCNDPRPDTARPPRVEEELLLEELIAPGEEFDISVEIPGAPGVYSATLLARNPTPISGPRYGAMSRGVVIPTVH